MQRLDYREWLKREFESRSRRNPRYSLRAFARDLGILPSRLSEVLKGHYGLSPAAAEAIARRLGLSASETKRFRDLVESRHARSRAQRKLAEQRVREARKLPARVLDLDHFRLISDWYHYGILELTYVQGFKNDARWISNALEVPLVQVELAIERLKRLGLLIEGFDGKLRANDEFTDTPNDVPSEGLKRHHEQLIDKAGKSVYTQGVDQRELNSIMFSFDRKDMGEARAVIREFRDEFCKRFGSSQQKNSVYCLAVQFFDLTPNASKVESLP